MGGRCQESIPMERGKGARWAPARPGTWGALGTEGAGPPRPDPALRGGIGPARDKTLRGQQERGPAAPPSHIPAAHPSKTPPACRAPPGNPGTVPSGDTSATSPQAGEQIPAPGVAPGGFAGDPGAHGEIPHSKLSPKRSQLRFGPPGPLSIPWAPRAPRRSQA